MAHEHRYRPHKVTITKWIDGILKTTVEYHDNFVEALQHSSKHNALIKIYDIIGELIYTNEQSFNTYA